MSEILHRIAVDAPPAKVLPVVTTAEGLRTWWTDDCEAKPEVGAVLRFRFNGGAVEMPFRVDEISPSRVAWTCVSGPKLPPEWLGTRVEFDLQPRGSGGTDLRFAHSNWGSTSGGYSECNTTWGELMHRLKAAAEGHPRGAFFTSGKA